MFGNEAIVQTTQLAGCRLLKIKVLLVLPRALIATISSETKWAPPIMQLLIMKMN